MAADGVVHLIDDDQGVRGAVAFLLSAAGFTVRDYESASAFLEVIATIQPGCVITDIRMPGIDGLTLQRLLRSRDIDLPVIVMTGAGDVPLARQAIRAGAVDFIEKPFADEILVAAVRTALSRHNVR